MSLKICNAVLFVVPCVILLKLAYINLRYHLLCNFKHGPYVSDIKLEITIKRDRKRLNNSGKREFVGLFIRLS